MNLIANALLIPHFHALGAVYGTVLAEIAVFTVQLYKLPIKFDFRPFMGNTVPYFIIGALMAVAVRLVSRASLQPMILVSVEILTGGISFIISCFVFWKVSNKSNLIRRFLK